MDETLHWLEYWVAADGARLAVQYIGQQGDEW